MNKKALFGMSLVAFASLIVIVSIGLAFGLLFGLDIVSKLGMVTQDQVIKDIDNINSISKIILDFLNTKDEQGTPIADLIILSIKNNNYKTLEKESEKYFEALPKDIYWKFIIQANGKNLFEVNRGIVAWKFDEGEVEGRTLHKIDFATPLSNYPELSLIFSLRKGHIETISKRGFDI